MQAEHCRQRLRQRAFADPRLILDQQVPARQQAGDRQSDLHRLAQDHPPHGIEDARQGVGIKGAGEGDRHGETLRSNKR